MITIAYITCGVHDLQQQTLKALFQYTPQDCQIIILQNGCVVEYDYPCEITLLKTDEIVGIPQSRNLCLDNVKGDVVIWIDDDVLVCENYVSSFAFPYEALPHVGITGYETLIITEDFWYPWYVDPYETGGMFDYFEYPYAVSMVMIEEIGNYDENVAPFVCDNTDLCLRAWSTGWRLIWFTNPGIKHWRGNTARPLSYRDKKYTNAFLNENKHQVHTYMQRKHGNDWHKRYNISNGPHIVNPQLEFPEKKGRYGGPEDKQEKILEFFGL